MTIGLLKHYFLLVVVQIIHKCHQMELLPGGKRSCQLLLTHSESIRPNEYFATNAMNCILYQ